MRVCTDDVHPELGESSFTDGEAIWAKHTSEADIETFAVES